MCVYYCQCVSIIVIYLILLSKNMLLLQHTCYCWWLYTCVIFNDTLDERWVSASHVVKCNVKIKWKWLLFSISCNDIFQKRAFRCCRICVSTEVVEPHTKTAEPQSTHQDSWTTVHTPRQLNHSPHTKTAEPQSTHQDLDRRTTHKAVEPHTKTLDRWTTHKTVEPHTKTLDRWTTHSKTRHTILSVGREPHRTFRLGS